MFKNFTRKLPYISDEMIAYTLGVCFVFLVWLLVHDFESQEETDYIFKAWSKAYPETRLSQAEWATLREHHLLPGSCSSSDDAAAIGLMSGAALGLAASGRR